MQWVIDNWIWILLGAAFIGMHMFGHGGHGSSAKPADNDEHAGHSGHSCCGGHEKKGKCCGGSSKKKPQSKPDAEPGAEPNPVIGNQAMHANSAVRRRGS